GAGGGGGAAHERDPIRENVPDGPPLDRVAVLLAQQPRGGEGAAVGELGEAERDQGEVRQVGGNVVDALAGVEAKAKRRIAARKSVALGEPALPRQGRGCLWQRLAIDCPHPRIAPE